jgi:hypothetical protein
MASARTKVVFRVVSCTDVLGIVTKTSFNLGLQSLIQETEHDALRGLQKFRPERLANIPNEAVLIFALCMCTNQL